MQIATSTREPVRHVAPWQLDDKTGAPKPGASVFLIRVADVLERGAFEAELAGRHGAGKVWPFELKEAADRGLRELLRDAPAMLDRALELCRACHAFELEVGADRETWAGIEGALRAMGGEYAELSARAQRRAELLPTVAAARFLAGWENVASVADGEPLAFRTGSDGRVDLEVLGEVEAMLLQSAGMRAYELQYLRRAAPLSPRSRSVVGRKTSTSGAKTPGASPGKSRARPGRKTRA